jgi:hypothetical protein
MCIYAISEHLKYKLNNTHYYAIARAVNTESRFLFQDIRPLQELSDQAPLISFLNQIYNIAERIIGNMAAAKKGRMACASMHKRILEIETE